MVIRKVMPEMIIEKLKSLMPHDSNFAFAFLLLGPTRRDALKAAYGFCRAVDDAVDEVKNREAGLEILNAWREQLKRAYRGDATTLEAIALQKAIKDFDIRQQDLADILTGVEMDLTKTRYENFEELYRYCYHVASAVGLVAIEIFGYARPETKLYAEKLGIALQLTNILRDVKEDAERGRIYLPQADMRRFGVSEDDILSGRYSPAFFEMMAYFAGRAHCYYEEARAALPRSERRHLAAAETMGDIYFSLLQAIEAKRFRVFDGRVTLPTTQKAGIAFSNFVRQALPV